MGTDREKVVPNVGEVVLNFGCGFNKLIGGINIDAFEVCEPDVLWDLNEVPLPFEDNSVDYIVAKHIFEHLKTECWWDTFTDCGRILKSGGILEMRVPHESSKSAGTYRDHNTIFTLYSFHGLPATFLRQRNAWAHTIKEVPFKMVEYQIVPLPKHEWMLRWGMKWFLEFAAEHLRNFIWEQAFVFKKITDEEIKSGQKTRDLELKKVLEEQRRTTPQGIGR